MSLWCCISPNEEIIILDNGNRYVIVLDNRLNLWMVIEQGGDDSRLYSRS